MSICSRSSVRGPGDERHGQRPAGRPAGPRGTRPGPAPRLPAGAGRRRTSASRSSPRARSAGVFRLDGEHRLGPRPSGCAAFRRGLGANGLRDVLFEHEREAATRPPRSPRPRPAGGRPPRSCSQYRGGRAGQASPWSAAASAALATPTRRRRRAGAAHGGLRRADHERDGRSVRTPRPESGRRRPVRPSSRRCLGHAGLGTRLTDRVRGRGRRRARPGVAAAGRADPADRRRTPGRRPARRRPAASARTPPPLRAGTATSSDRRSPRRARARGSPARSTPPTTARSISPGPQGAHGQFAAPAPPTPPRCKR